MWSDEEHREHVHLIEQQLHTLATRRPNKDQTYMISATQPYVIDYKERQLLYGWSPNPLILSVEDIGFLGIPANTWVNLQYQQSMRLFPEVSQTSTIPFFVRATDYYIYPSGLPAATIAVAPFGSNPAQTAAGGADTLYKFGPAGTIPVNHVVIQNNTGSSIFYAFDQSTVTPATNQIYTLANAATIFWDRSVSVLHFSSAAQQSFNGQTGITVEGFL